jgi:hypothetical protein
MPPLTSRSVNRPPKALDSAAVLSKSLLETAKGKNLGADLVDSKTAQSPTATAGQSAKRPRPEGESKEAKNERRSKRAKERYAKETADWVRKYSKAIKSFTFYFDSIEPHQQAELTRILHQLEAVRCVFLSSLVFFQYQ